MNRQPLSPEAYSRLVSRMTPRSRHLTGCLRAFWVGGAICCIGQALNLLAERMRLTELTAPMFTSVALIFLGTTLTGIGVYDKIGRYAGAGSIMCPSPALRTPWRPRPIEYRREGVVLGIGARIFQLAGPVLTFGITSSMLVGFIYYAVRGWLL